MLKCVMQNQNLQACVVGVEQGCLSLCFRTKIFRPVLQDWDFRHMLQDKYASACSRIIIPRPVFQDRMLRHVLQNQNAQTSLGFCWCLDIKMFRHKDVWTERCLNIKMIGHKDVWTCVITRRCKDLCSGTIDGRFVWPNHVLEYAVFVWESSDCWIVFINCLSTSKLQS